MSVNRHSSMQLQTLTSSAATHPFTTIAPNMGITYARVECVCREFGVQDNPVHSICTDGIRFIPVKIMDVAGLSQGPPKERA